jgi:hypothetical protein
MALSWNEIKERAVKFSKEWEDGWNEKADAQSFLIDFFNVFGISRRRVATFEHKVKKLDDARGYIDLLWKGNILIEMKSKGENLEKAYSQALEYTYGLKDAELTKFILISDFDRFILYDLDEKTSSEFKLKNLVQNVELFGSMIGYQKTTFKEQDPVNIEAAELMAKLHDRLKNIGYTGHYLEVYLVRLLFCLFADDTTIFEKQQFFDYITQRTNEDGSDLASKLQELFQVLNTPRENRFKNLDEQLNEFPYINGKLFEEVLPIASFDTNMRQALLDCSTLDWGKISPAIFGSMFQSVMNPVERRNLGAHYTSEQNILKLINPLFMDELWKEFEDSKHDKRKLTNLHSKISKLTFLDPACGCGNFLVVTYRELRLLELEIFRVLNKFGQRVFDVGTLVLLNVDQFYGIEYEEFPARIAEVAMWLMDHQMNMLVGQEFGEYFVRLPLKKAATIVNVDALEISWESILKEKVKLNYILGNPPFSGSKLMSQFQRDQVVKEFNGKTGSGTLDFVTAWYAKAAKFIQDTDIKVAFVSTNSIVQGEQVGVLWDELLNKYNVKIHFAHRTFKWTNEAKGVAAVYCVIIGFSTEDNFNKYIFEYEDIKGEPHKIKAKNINPYLVDADNVIITKRRNPICNIPKMLKGSQPTDGGNFLFTEEEKNEFMMIEPKANKYIKPLISAHEFINGQNRFCLWLVDADPRELKNMPHVLKRIEGVREMRLKSTKQATVKWANQPMLFTENRQPKSEYILIPRHSSENRKYIPMGFFDENSIVSDSCLFIAGAQLYHFGILMSAMHMAWVKYVCGRIKSDYRYSNEIVYTNYPWPEAPTEKQILNIEEKAQNVLDVRELFPNASLADLYDPRTMPHQLVKAHQELDKAVDLAYRPQPFPNEAKRMEFLFELYDKYVGQLFTTAKKKK